MPDAPAPPLDRAAFKARLRDIRARIHAGETCAARKALEELERLPGLAALDSPTVLGLPRKLVAARLSLAKAEGDEVARAGYQYHLVPDPSLWTPHLAQSEAERQAALAAAGQAVPRVIHQIWIGPRAAPANCAAWARHAQAQGYRYRLWREADLAAAGIADHPAFAALVAEGEYPGAVDVARYLILAQEGGIYLDCDWYPLRDDLGFHDRLPLLGLAAFVEEAPRLSGSGPFALGNSFIAAPPGHPVMARMLRAIPALMAALPQAPAWWITGPLLFTAIARSGPLCLADAALIAGTAPAARSEVEVQALCAGLRSDHPGLLLAWKPWAADHL